MQIVALEEHFVTRSMLEVWVSLSTAVYDRTAEFGKGKPAERLLDVDAARLADMDDIGIDVQVLSLNAPEAIARTLISTAIGLKHQTTSRKIFRKDLSTTVALLLG